MRGDIPTLQCNGDDGFCSEWAVDHYATGASSVDGVRLTTTLRSPGWVSSDFYDLCPEHISDAKEV